MHTKDEIAALILCGGKSVRMGEIKPLTTLYGKEFLELLLTSYLNTPFNPVIIITGQFHDKIEAYLKLKNFSNNSRIKIIYNETFEKGQFYSVQKGVNYLASFNNKSAGFAIHPIDAPLVKAETLNLLWDSFQKNPDKIILPYYRKPEDKGHPVIFSFAFIHRFLEEDQGEGARSVIYRHADKLELVQTTDKAIITNFNSKNEVLAFEKNNPLNE